MLVLSTGIRSDDVCLKIPVKQGDTQRAKSGTGDRGGFMLKAWRLSISAAVLLTLSLLLAACGSPPPTATPQPTPTPFNTEELRSLVQDAVAGAMPAEAPPAESGEPALTEEQLQSLVAQAVSDSVAASMTPGLTAEDVEELVQAAVESAMTPGVALAQVESAIAEALAAEAERMSQLASQEPLVVYSGRSESLVDAVIQQFSQATGIEVAVKYAGTPQLAATLLEEGGNSPADIFFAQDPGALGPVEGMLAPLPDRVLSRVPDWARSPQGKWVGLSGRARTVVYNPQRISEAELPDDVWDFVNPEWKGRIGWAPTNASFQTMVTAMRALWGEEKTTEWLEGVQANNPIIYPKNTPQVAAVAAGEIDVGLVNHYYLFRFLAEEGEDFAARNYHPRAGGPGATVMVAGAGILASSDNRDAAERFLEFMLSRVGQQYFAGQTFEYPLVDGVKVSRVLVPLDEINHPSISPKDLADLEGTQRLLRETGVLP